jgi:aspartate racemase
MEARKEPALKTIGLVGGMSYESTITYYRAINDSVKARLGGHHSAKLQLCSVDFAEVEQLQKTGRWDEAGRMLARCAQTLEGAGAECIVLCTNTMHAVAPAIERSISVPFLHIADPTADAIKTAQLHTVLLLGTRFTMEQDFYKERLREKHGLEVLLPNAQERETVHRVIYEELVHGKLLAHSRDAYLRLIERLAGEGAQGVILGCTEIGLLVRPSDLSLPVFDTSALHAEAAVEFALAPDPHPAAEVK